LLVVLAGLEAAVLVDILVRQTVLLEQPT